MPRLLLRAWKRVLAIFWVDLVVRTVRGWSQDGVSRRSAALAYYTVFSLSPLFVIILAILGAVFDRGRLQEQLLGQLSALAGDSAARLVGEMLDSASKPGAGLVSSIIGVGVLLVTAMGVFVEVKESLNAIWRVPPPQETGIRVLLRRYLAPLAMVLVIGFLLLVSLVLSAGLAVLGAWLGDMLPGAGAILHVADYLFSCSVFGLLFVMIYRILPDRRLPWRDIWHGALVAAILFSIGRTLIGLYLGRTTTVSAYGAAGSLVVILAWVFYSAQILYIGAEFSRAWTERRADRRLARDELASRAGAGGGEPVPARRSGASPDDTTPPLPSTGS